LPNNDIRISSPKPLLDCHLRLETLSQWSNSIVFPAREFIVCSYVPLVFKTLFKKVRKSMLYPPGEGTGYHVYKDKLYRVLCYYCN